MSWDLAAFLLVGVALACGVIAVIGAWDREEDDE